MTKPSLHQRRTSGVMTALVSLAIGACAADRADSDEDAGGDATGAAESELGGSCPCQAELAAPPAEAGATFWVRGRDLFPAWGYYPVAGDPQRDSIGPAPLTWVPHLPPPSPHPRRVFVQTLQYVQAEGRNLPFYLGGMEGEAKVDDRALEGSPSGPLGRGWVELGTIPADIGEGPHHIEAQPHAGLILGAVMITTSADPGLPAGFLAEAETDLVPVPPPIAEPVTRFPRHHRRAFPPRVPGGPPTHQWALGTAERFDEDFTNWHDFDGPPLLSAEGARNQTIAVGFSMAFRAVKAAKGGEEQVVQISPTDIVSSDGARIPANRVDIRVALVRDDVSAHYETVVPRPVARLLVKNDLECPVGEGGWPSFELCTNERRGAVRPMGLQGAGALVCESGLCAPPPATTAFRDGDERQFWVTIDTAGLSETGTETPPPAGLYRGTIRLATDDGSGNEWDVPLEVQLHDFTLPDAPGKNGVIYSKCIDDGLPFSACTEHFASPEEVARDRRDQRAHGLDAFQSQNAFNGLDLAAASGFEAPHLRNAMISADTSGDVRDPRMTCTAADCPTVSYPEGLALATEGWNITRFLCDEPAPPSLDVPPISGCAASVGAEHQGTYADVLTGLANIGIRETALGRRTAITLNHPQTVRKLAPFFGDAIVAISTTGLANELHVLAGRQPEVPCSIGPGGSAPRSHLAYWDAAPTYPILHRALAGRFIRTMRYDNPACPSGPVFDGVFVNSFDQGWLSGFTYPDENQAPIPTARWEALREGLDDARYHEALMWRFEHAEKVLANTPESDPRYIGLYRAHEVAKLALRRHDVQASAHSFLYFHFLGAGVAARPPSRGERLPLDEMRHDYAAAVVMLDRELARFA